MIFSAFSHKRKIRYPQNSSPLLLLSAFLLMILIFISGSTVSHSENTPRRVLFISSYSESWVTVPDQLDGLRSVFDEHDITVEFEFMDTKKLSSEENITYFHDYLKYKLENLPPYLGIIVGDDAALQFAMDYQEELFPDLPIVFFAINDLGRAATADSYPNMAGSVEETNLKDNIALALKLNPSATTVVGIVDDSLSGQGDQKQLLSIAPEFPDLEFEFLNASYYTYDEIWNLLANYSDDTILIFQSLNQDKTGYFLGFHEINRMIGASASVPVYRATVGGVGEGLLGGKMIDYYQMAAYSADVMMKVLQGEDIDTIPLLLETPYFYTFDYDVLSRFNIDSTLLPEDSIIINEPDSLWSLYQKYFYYIFLAIVFIVMVFVILIIDNIKSKMLQRKLSLRHEELTALYEELTMSQDELRSQKELLEYHDQEISSLYEKYHYAINGTNSAVWDLDLKTQNVTISKEIQNMISDEVQITGDPSEVCQTLFQEGYCETVKNAIYSYVSGVTDEVNIQAKARTSNGTSKWLLVRARGVYDDNNKIVKLFGIFSDITNIKTQEEYANYLAHHDYLTSLPNRLAIMEKLNEMLASNMTGTAILLDIDNFKTINDTMGHMFGDQILIMVAKRLAEYCNEKVHIGRVGGDEFLILLSDTQERAEIEYYLSEIRTAFSKPLLLDETSHYINFSMGITTFPEDGRNMNQLLMNADTAMYNIKQSGRNNFAYYEASMKTEVERKHDIENLLREALNKNSFYLLFQPQVEIEHGTIVSFEALIRLRDSISIGPGIFIPIAEETGLIIEIGRWVAKEAIAILSEMRDQNVPMVPVAINYSSKQIRDTGFLDFLKRKLKENEISTEMIHIEITEGVLLENDSATMNFLRRAKKAGFKIILDDFGTGYSSLNYLTYMPVDRVKLDKSINDKFLEYEDSTVMKSLILLAHSLELTITAEGIECWSQYVKLKEFGCDYIQGYLFSKPVEKERIQDLLDRNLLEQAAEEARLVSGSYPI